MNYTLLVPIIRHGLQALGGYLVARGYLDESSSEAFIGFAINGGALAWWAVDRWRARHTSADTSADTQEPR
jgi:hypothetical protein